MTATEEATALAQIAAQAAADKLASRHRPHRRQRPACHHRRLRRRHRQQRAPGRGHRRRRRGAGAARRPQADPSRGPARRPLGAARLRRRRRPRAALRGACVLRARAAVEGLPLHPVHRRGRRGARRRTRRRYRRVTSRRVVLLRHGRTAWNAERRFQGQADPPLDEVGRAQAYEVAALIAALRPGLLVSSDAIRAMQTAEVVAEASALPVVKEPRLRERNLGHWEGLTREDVAERYPDEYADWMAGMDVSRRGGETREEVAARAERRLRRAAAGGGHRPRPAQRDRHGIDELRCSASPSRCTRSGRSPTATGRSSTPSRWPAGRRLGACGGTIWAYRALSSRCPPGWTVDDASDADA